MPIMNNPYHYVQHVEMQRQRNVAIQTQDGLGVTKPLLQGENHILFPIHKHIDPDLKLLQEYLFSSPVASRLALFRDIQLNYTLQDNQELYRIVADAMDSMGLVDEATRISEK